MVRASLLRLMQEPTPEKVGWGARPISSLISRHQTAQAPKTSWRDGCRYMRPPIKSRKLPLTRRSLAGDLAKNGLKVPVVLVRVAGASPQLLDGRHRLDLLEDAGTSVIDADGNVLVLHQIVDVADDAEAEQLSLSLNAHRRQLREDKWRELLRAQIIATPEASNRKIGKITGKSHPVVAAERENLEATGKVLPVEKTVGRDGKARKVKKKPRRSEEDFKRDLAAKKKAAAVVPAMQTEIVRDVIAPDEELALLREFARFVIGLPGVSSKKHNHPEWNLLLARVKAVLGAVP